MDNFCKNACLTMVMFFVCVSMYAQPTMIASVAVQAYHNNTRMDDSVKARIPKYSYWYQNYWSHQNNLRPEMTAPTSSMQNMSACYLPHALSNVSWVSAGFSPLNYKQMSFT